MRQYLGWYFNWLPLGLSFALTSTDLSAGTVDVTQYGANGADDNDDTAALQAAINAIGVAGTVYIPGGNYIVSASLTLGANSAKNIRIIGDGIHSSRIIQTTASHLIDFLFPDERYNLTIENICLSAGTMSARSALRVGYTYFSDTSREVGLIADKISITVETDTQFGGKSVAGKWENGIELNKAWRSNISNSQLTNRSVPFNVNTPEGLLWTGGNAIFVNRQTSAVNISDCFIALWHFGIEFYNPNHSPGNQENHEGFTIRNSTISANTGIHFGHGTGANFLNSISVVDCDFDCRPGGCGLDIDAVDHLTVRGNFFAPSGHIPIQVRCRESTISSNIIQNHALGSPFSDYGGYGGIVLMGSGSSPTVPFSRNNTIIGNTFADVSRGATIWIQSGGSKNVVMGNTFNNCLWTIYDQANSVVTGNTP